MRKIKIKIKYHFIDITSLSGPFKFISVTEALTIVANCNLSPSAIVLFFCNFSVICCTVITVVIVSAVDTKINNNNDKICIICTRNNFFRQILFP